MSTKAHAKYSASGSERWLGCPGSLKLSSTVPVPPESKYAAEGTRAHEALEFMIKNRRKRLSAEAILRKKYGVQMAVHAARALSEVEKLAPPGAEILAESRIDLSFVHPGMFGTSDIGVIEHFGELISIDYKYGAGVLVEPVGKDGRANSQLAYYALGLAHRYDYNFSTVRLTVVQPRFEHKLGPVRSHVMAIDELMDWAHVFKKGVNACEREERKPLKKLTLRAGKWCKFCPAKNVCPEYKNLSMRQAQDDFDDLPEDDDTTVFHKGVPVR